MSEMAVICARLFAVTLLLLPCLWTVARAQIVYDPGDPLQASPSVYRANETTEPERYEIQQRCKNNATRPEGDIQVDLFAYSTVLVDWFPFALEETNAPNADPFQEDCQSIGVDSTTSNENRSVIKIDSTNTCHDVLFFDGGDPVVCLYYPTPSTGQFYFPENEEEAEIEARCKEELFRPKGSEVGLIFYDSQPDNGAGPGYTLLYTSLENNNTHNDSCDEVLQSGPPTPETEGRPVILIHESNTCHDVLFFVNDSANPDPNPVVCLYFPAAPPIPPVGSSAVISDGLLISTLFFASLSIVASFILLFTHVIFPSLRTLPSKVVMNLALSFLLADITIIVQTVVIVRNSDEIDTIDIIGLVSFYFFFARWVWMAMSGFEMCRTIHVGTQLRFDSDKKRQKIFLAYLLSGWSLPLIPTIIMAIVHFEELENDIGHISLFGIGGFVVTLVPVGIVVIVNASIVVYLTYVLYQAHMWQIKVSDAITSHKRKTNFTRIFIIILSILGLTWFLLLLLYIDGANTEEWVQILYTIFNSSQPIFVCVAFVGTKKIFRKYRSLFVPQVNDDSEAATLQNRFRTRRLISFLFTDRELAESLPKYRFGRSNRHNSKASVTSISMLSRDSTNSIPVKQPPPSNGTCSPPKNEQGLTPISEEMEPEERKSDVESPTHVTVDLKDSSA